MDDCNKCRYPDTIEGRYDNKQLKANININILFHRNLDVNKVMDSSMQDFY